MLNVKFKFLVFVLIGGLSLCGSLAVAETTSDEESSESEAREVATSDEESSEGEAREVTTIEKIFNFGVDSSLVGKDYLNSGELYLNSDGEYSNTFKFTITRNVPKKKTSSHYPYDRKKLSYLVGGIVGLDSEKFRRIDDLNEFKRDQEYLKLGVVGMLGNESIGFYSFTLGREHANRSSKQNVVSLSAQHPSGKIKFSLNQATAQGTNLQEQKLVRSVDKYINSPDAEHIRAMIFEYALSVDEKSSLSLEVASYDIKERPDSKSEQHYSLVPTSRFGINFSQKLSGRCSFLASGGKFFGYDEVKVEAEDDSTVYLRLGSRCSF